MDDVLDYKPVITDATVKKKEQRDAFFKKGVTVALLSGASYGLYSAFMTLAMTKGVWGDWYGPNAFGLSIFAITFLVPTLGSGVNDACSAIWAFANAARQGKAMEFFRSVPTKPGVMMILAALVGGPIASAAYVIALQMAGSIVIPITALCPAIGAILSRVLFKQPLNGRQMAGIAFTNAGLGINHSLAHTIGGKFHIAHGRLNGILLPYVIRFHSERSPAVEERLKALSIQLGLSENESFEQALIKLLQSLDFESSLSELGIEAHMYYDALASMTEDALADRCTSTNPVLVTRTLLANVLRDAYEN